VPEAHSKAPNWVVRPSWKLRDVPDGRAAEAIQTLVFISGHAEVAALLGEIEEQLLLDVVGVLILIDRQVSDFARKHRLVLGVEQKSVTDGL
jgi:hypothetical protein